MRFELYDVDGNKLEVTNNSFKRLSDTSTIESEIVEKTWRAGADILGIKRDESKSITFIYDIYSNSETTFRQETNEFRQFVRKAVTVRDSKNDIETSVVLTDFSIEHLEGGYLHMSRNEVTFKQLIPFWEDEEYTTVEVSSSQDSIVIDNTGYIDTPPIITIEAQEQITKFSVRVAETGEGILISDLQFGLLGLTTYIIDCKEGTAELNQILRNMKIKDGTGFFNLQVGVNTLEFSLSGSAIISIQYKKRYYI